MKLRYAPNYAPRFGDSLKRTPALCLATLIALTSCSKSGTIDNRDQAGSNPAGIAATESDQGAGQTITHRDDTSSARIAEIQIPPGALAVNQSVTMASSYHTDPSDLLAEFNIDKTNGIKETQVATVISSNVDKNLDQPMTIALDLPAAKTSLFGLVWDQRNFFVVYTLWDSASKVWRRGIMPEKSLSLDNNRIVFKSLLFGRYEIFESVKPIETATKVEVAIAKPDFTNPPVALTQISPLVVRPLDRVKVSGKYLTAKTEVEVGGIKADTVLWHDSNTLEFKMPKVGFGEQVVTIRQGASSATGSVIVNTFAANVPYIAAKAADVCSGTTYANEHGILSLGTKACTLPACQSDGETGCITSPDFPAFNTADIDADKMFQTVKVHKITGNIAAPAYTLPCSQNGQIGCQVQGRYTSIKAGVLTPDVVKRGYRIPKFGPNGGDLVGDYPNSNAPLPGKLAGYGVLNNPNLAAAVTSLAGKSFQYWDKEGNAHTFVSEGSLKPNVIRSGAKIFGIVGNLPIETKEPCSAEKNTNCHAEGSFIGVDGTILHEKHIAFGQKIGGIVGKFPSAAYPLSGVDSAISLNRTNFTEALKSGRQIEYFDSTGKLHTAIGSSNLLPRHIKKGTTLFGVTGTMEAFDNTNLKPENIRYGVDIGNVTGAYKVNCRDLADLAKFNYQVSPGSAELDQYDTVTAHSLPASNPWPGQDGYVCDESGWQDITDANSNNGCTTLNDSCLWQDRSTKLIWGGYHATKSFGIHADAVKYCNNLVVGSRTNWRLPTIRQLMQAYVNGITTIKKKHPQFIEWSAGNSLWSESGWGPAEDREVYYLYSKSGKVKKAKLSNEEQTNALCIHD